MSEHTTRRFIAPTVPDTSIRVREAPAVVTQCPHCHVTIGRLPETDVMCPRARRKGHNK